MNLTRKEHNFEVDNEKYVMYFDMKSMVTYKELSGEDFSIGLGKLFNENAETFIYMIASTVRRVTDTSKPLGAEILEGNVMYWLLNYRGIIEQIILDALPEAKEDSKKKK